ncbi:MAG: thiolase family protein [Sulfolobaceae archaeon]
MIVGFSGKLYKKYEGSSFDLLLEAFEEALEMSGLELKDIDGLLIASSRGIFDGKTYLSSPFHISHILGIKPKFFDQINYGGPSALTMIYRAYKAIKANEAETVVCIQGGKISDIRERRRQYSSEEFGDTPFDEFFRIYDNLDPISDYAMVAYRHYKLFGTSDEQRALVSVYQRRNAMGNKKAMFRDPITVKDVLESRIVSYPLHLLEIVYPIDGFHVFIVSKKESRSKLKNINILGYGEAHWSGLPSEWDDIIYTPTIESSKRAGVNLEKIDAFQLYDSFTITVMLQLEDIGLVEKGKVGKFVEENDLTYKGNIPVNTGGGSLNTGQPAYMSGGVILEEALLQLNNMAEGRQVSDVKNVLINGIGWWSRAHAVTLVLGE